MKEIGKIVGLIVIGIALLVGVALLFCIPVWLLWNWLAPALFGLPEITLIQTWGLSLLVSMLFKGASITVKE